MSAVVFGCGRRNAAGLLFLFPMKMSAAQLPHLNRCYIFSFLKQNGANSNEDARRAWQSGSQQHLDNQKVTTDANSGVALRPGKQRVMHLFRLHARWKGPLARRDTWRHQS